MADQSLMPAKLPHDPDQIARGVGDRRVFRLLVEFDPNIDMQKAFKQIRRACTRIIEARPYRRPIRKITPGALKRRDGKILGPEPDLDFFRRRSVSGFTL